MPQIKSNHPVYSVGSVETTPHVKTQANVIAKQVTETYVLDSEGVSSPKTPEGQVVVTDGAYVDPTGESIPFSSTKQNAKDTGDGTVTTTKAVYIDPTGESIPFSSTKQNAKDNDDGTVTTTKAVYVDPTGESIPYSSTKQYDVDALENEDE